MSAIIIIATLLLLGYSVLICMYMFGWNSIQAFQTNKRNSDLFITVIIPARNEEKNIGRLLESLSAQIYPGEKFEIIVIDDDSTDGTAAVVNGFEQSNVRLIELSKYTVGQEIKAHKKKAIETGISHSKGELIVTTDADCVADPNWLQTIADFYALHRPEMIVMPVDIQPTNTFIQVFQALDFLALQGITAASVSRSWHGMCNGANLAYNKKAFETVNGFEGINHIASGDDMLLMHKISKKFPGKIKYLLSGGSIVRTLPVNHVGEFLQQRIRWAGKSNQYQDKSILPVLLMVYLLNLLLLLMPIFGLFYSARWNYMGHSINMIDSWLILIGIKTLIEIIFLIPVARFFGKSRLLWLFPMIQPFHWLYTVIAGSFGYVGSYEWKGRKLK